MSEKDIQKGQRIAEIRRHFCSGRNKLFAEKIGKDTTYSSQICNGSKPIGSDTLERILRAFPDVSRQWLYFGEGDMLQTSADDRPDFAAIIRQQSETIAALTETNRKQAERIEKLINMLAKR